METNVKAARARPAGEPVLEVVIGPIPEANLAACARVLGRFAVEKALSDLRLDTGSTSDDNGQPHKAAPPGVGTPNGAKEQVP